jgi:Tfp pilus assembly protein PilF
MENTKDISNQISETASVLEMAVHYEKANQFELAEEYYKKAYAKGDSFASISLADLYNKQGKLDLAEEWYRKESGDHDSCAGDGNNALAHFLVEQGREDEAWKCFEQILFIMLKNNVSHSCMAQSITLDFV